jgi:hypothetical protein
MNHPRHKVLARAAFAKHEHISVSARGQAGIIEGAKKTGRLADEEFASEILEPSALHGIERNARFDESIDFGTNFNGIRWAEHGVEGVSLKSLVKELERA